MRLARLGALCTCAAFLAVGCGTDGGSEGGGPAGGASAVGGSAGAAAGGGSGIGGAGGDAGSAPTGPHLVVPNVVALPYVVAGAGGTSALLFLRNDGSEAFAWLTVAIEGDDSLSLEGSPAALPAGAEESLTVHYEGSQTEQIARAEIVVSFEGGSASIPVYAVAGDPGLGEASWQPVAGAGGLVIGDGATIGMPSAPYPDEGAPFTDDGVHVFVPSGYRDRGAQTLAVHFHGHSTTVAETLTSHRYREHVYASGSNVVLVVPQGPVETASGDFGKLMDPGGLDALVREVLVVLYRDAVVEFPDLDALVLTSHSGGYAAVATNLRADALAPPVDTVLLFDSLYAEEATYEAFVLGGGWLRSNYTAGGGTLDNNEYLVDTLVGEGVAVARESTTRSLRDDRVVIYATDASHSGATRIDGAYGEQLRWRLTSSRNGPRIELREAVASGANATVRWLAPPDEDVTGFVIETSTDGQSWSLAASASTDASTASFPVGSGARVRVRGLIAGLDETLPSDEARVDPSPHVLVVDGFDRVIDGSSGELSHDFAARVGEAVGAVATVSNEAITEDAFPLDDWPLVVWLLGDESTADRALSDSEIDLLVDYVDGGGRLVLSGSEAAWALAPTSPGAYFLSHVCDAGFVADDAGTLTVAGAGPLVSLGSFGFGGPAAPYDEDYPDVLAEGTTAVELLQYATGGAAAVGLAGSCVLVGFPLELVDEPGMLDELMASLVSFVEGG